MLWICILGPGQVITRVLLGYSIIENLLMHLVESWLHCRRPVLLMLADVQELIRYLGTDLSVIIDQRV